MSYKKISIDELHADKVFVEFREISKEGKGPLIIKSFDLDKIGEVEPKVKEMVAGDIIGVYYEQMGTRLPHTEKQWLDGKVENLSEILICSNVSITDVCDEQFEEFRENKNIFVKIEKIDGYKCPRCWKTFKEKFKNELCARCEQVVDKNF